MTTLDKIEPQGKFKFSAQDSSLYVKTNHKVGNCFECIFIGNDEHSSHITVFPANSLVMEVNDLGSIPDKTLLLLAAGALMATPKDFCKTLEPVIQWLRKVAEVKEWTGKK